MQTESKSSAVKKYASKQGMVRASVMTDTGEMMYFYPNPYVDENGNEREYMPGDPEYIGMHLGSRTKHSHPYSYDPLLQWKKHNETPALAHAVYSDRMAQWDYKKYRSLCEEHFAGIGHDRGGDYFSERSPARIEAFMRAYFDKPKLELVRIEEHCNWSSGYPVWAFFYVDPDEPVTVKYRDVKTQGETSTAKASRAPAPAPVKVNVNRVRASSMRARARQRKAATRQYLASKK